MIKVWAIRIAVAALAGCWIYEAVTDFRPLPDHCQPSTATADCPLAK